MSGWVAAEHNIYVCMAMYIVNEVMYWLPMYTTTMGYPWSCCEPHIVVATNISIRIGLISGRMDNFCSIQMSVRKRLRNKRLHDSPLPSAKVKNGPTKHCRQINKYRPMSPLRSFLIQSLWIGEANMGHEEADLGREEASEVSTGCRLCSYSCTHCRSKFHVVETRPWISIG